MIPDVCAGAWSVERAMVEPTKWLDSHDDKDECEVTPRMIEMLRVALTEAHKAGAPRPLAYRGVGGIVVRWANEWPTGSVHGDRFRMAELDVEDDEDDDGSVGCVSFHTRRDSCWKAVFNGWNRWNIDDIADTIVLFLRGAPMTWVADRMPKGVGSGMNPLVCDDFAPGPYTCRIDPAGWHPTRIPTLTGGVCKEAASEAVRLTRG